MKIGIDLDDTLYKYPEFFKMLMQGTAEFYCTSGHTIQQFEAEDRQRLTELGFDVDKLDLSLLADGDHGGLSGKEWKAKIASQLDFVFDNHADVFQPLTKTPIFKVP